MMILPAPLVARVCGERRSTGIETCGPAKNMRHDEFLDLMILSKKILTITKMSRSIRSSAICERAQGTDLKY
jgi:hypothetical protein